MKLDRFINRPVLSTVISIIIVILGVIGLVTLPIEQYPDIAPHDRTLFDYFDTCNKEENICKSLKHLPKLQRKNFRTRLHTLLYFSF